MSDSTLKWLIERSHNAYLSFTGLWLASMLGMVNVLMGIASNSSVFYNHIFFTSSLYFALVTGMTFALYRLANHVKEIINWGKQIKDESLRTEILYRRGTLSKFIVDSEGKFCVRNRNFGLVLQIALAGLFFILVIFPN